MALAPDSFPENLRRSVTLTERLVSIPSVTPGEAAIVDWLEGWCREQGLEVRRQPVAEGRDNLVAWCGNNPRVWFSTHVDTVPPFLPFRREGDVLYGRGACDTHGGLACLMTVFADLQAEGHSLGLLLVVGEEVDHAGARRAGSADPLPAVSGPRSIVLCEPTGMRLVQAQKGVLKFVLTAHGIAAHSSLPERGDSAILKLLEANRRLLEAEWPTDPVLGPTYLNLGRIAGGVAANVIPPRAEAEFCLRTVSARSGYEAQVRALVGDVCDVEFEGAGEPQVFTALPGWETCVAPFGTDAEYLRPLGDVYLIGPGRIEVAHGKDESITLDELRAGLEGYRRLALQLLERR
jgi:acetylornithine deacetylase